VSVKAVAYAESEGYVPLNVNTWFDVETLSTLDKSGVLLAAGLKTGATELVHEFDRQQTRDYMQMLDEAMNRHDTSKVLSYDLLDGITYIGKDDENSQTSLNTARHQVIAIYNSANIPGNGWCGLDNGYLSPDSFGNTLIEMNSGTP
jgi:hypothetical protein